MVGPLELGRVVRPTNTHFAAIERGMECNFPAIGALRPLSCTRLKFKMAFIQVDAPAR
jgi:hypothetical protein